MKKESFIKTISRTDFRKLVNYYLNGRGKLLRFSSFKSDVVIFYVTTFENDMLSSIDSSFHFQSAMIKKGLIVSTWTCSVDKLKYLVNTITFFNRDEKSRLKMNFPVITLKGDYSKLLF
jgi:hypothetical protein